MDLKVLVGLSVTVGAVVAGGVYNFIQSDTAIKMSVGSGFVADGLKLLNSYKSNIARWTISVGAGVGAALLVPTINWLVSKLLACLGVRYFVKKELTNLLPSMQESWEDALLANKVLKANPFNGASSIAYANRQGRDYVMVPKADHIKPEHITYVAPQGVEPGKHYVIYDQKGRLYSNEKGEVAILPVYFNFNRKGSRTTYI